jgi:hypothetical protein
MLPNICYLYAFKTRCMKNFHVRSLMLLMMAIALISHPACKKDTDGKAPMIELTSPVDNHMYNAFDDIPVIGTVYDDVQLTYVRIQLIDQNMIPVLPGIQLTPIGNTFTLNHAYTIDDVLLESGTYYLQVQASDGVQATNKFVKLSVTEAPRKLKYVVAVTQNATQLNIVKIDSSFQITPLVSVSSDYLGSGVCNDYGLFYLGGSYTGDINVYDMTTWLKVWEVPVTLNPPFAWFTGMEVTGEFLRVGYRSGKYEKYNRYGNQTMSINTTTTWAPRKFCLISNKMVTEEKSMSGPENILEVRWEYSSAITGDYFISEDVVGMRAVDEENLVYVTNNASAQSTLYYFNINILAAISPASMGSGKAYGVYPRGTYVMVTHEQGVYFFNPTTLSFSNTLYEPKTKAAFFDETQGLLITGRHNLVKYFTDVSLIHTLQQTVTLSDSVVAVYGVYNKD